MAEAEKIKGFERQTIIDIKELNQYRDRLYQQLDKLEDDYYDQQRLTWNEFQQQEQQKIASYIDKLISEKSKFKSIFKTTSDSIYFIANDSSCWRIKKEKDKYSPQPITTDIFFVSHDTNQWLVKIRQQVFGEEKLVGQKIPTIDLANGAVPLELNIYQTPAKIVIDQSQDFIKILGVKFPDDDQLITRNISLGFHLGHPISKIIK